MPVGLKAISDRVEPGNVQLDLDVLYGEVNMIRRIEEKENRRYWSQYKRTVRRNRRSHG
jgi:hypothetical protein